MNSTLTSIARLQFLRKSGQRLAIFLSLMLVAGSLSGCKTQAQTAINDCRPSSVCSPFGHMVEKNGRIGLYTNNGKEILPCKFKKIQSYMGQLLVEKDECLGLYTTSGKEILPCEFDNIDFTWATFGCAKRDCSASTPRQGKKYCRVNSTTSTFTWATTS